MVVTDVIADMLTRIRNAQSTRKDSVSFEASRMKRDIAQILLDEGFINSFEEDCMFPTKYIVRNINDDCSLEECIDQGIKQAFDYYNLLLEIY